MWLAEKPLHPTYVNLEQSFEGWAYRNGLLDQIHRLEAKGFLESQTDARSGKRLHRLTVAGRAAAMSGRDPEVAWATPWDRKWRMFIFDIPERERSKRRQLTRALGRAGCGCLQGSVWIAPVTPPAISSIMAEDDPDCSHLLLLEADSKGKKMDSRMVSTAWDFDAINQRYLKLAQVLKRFPTSQTGVTRTRIEAWTRAEKAASHAALGGDPLLPAELLPKPYLGREVWQERRKTLSVAAKTVSQFAQEFPSARKHPLRYPDPPVNLFVPPARDKP